MNFTGEENHDFPLDKASEWTANYRKANPDQIKGHYFGRKAIRRLLSQKGCVGMRVYYALNEEAVKQLIIVGVDAHGDDLYEGLLAERSKPCPPVCGRRNPLNS